MKKIKLPYCSCKTVNTPQAREIINELQAQIDAPEPVEFWEGQLVDGRQDEGSEWNGPYRYTNWNADMQRHRMVETNGSSFYFRDCRPLQDPLVDQYKPLEYSEMCPIKDGVIKIKRSDGHASTVQAAWFNLHRLSTFRDVIGWMPADGWGSK